MTRLARFNSGVNNFGFARRSAGSASAPVYVEDVFSTYLYSGNVTNRDINTGIALGPSNRATYFNQGQINTDSSTTAFDLGTSDWTMECWFASTFATRIDPFELNGGTGNAEFFGLTLNLSATGDMQWNENTNARITATGTTVCDGLWHHIAITRSGNSVRMFLDGVQKGSTYTSSFTYGYNGAAMRFGNRWPGGISSTSKFYISNFRIVKGTALYTAGFTPPTQALTVVSGTTYLGFDNYSTFTDTASGIVGSVQSNVSRLKTGPFSSSTAGGLAWIKVRNVGDNHTLFDSARGPQKVLYSNLTAGEATQQISLTGFNEEGFSLGIDGDFNNTGENYAAWVFKKQPKFFDVVTYTGTGVAREISHNLGSVPGCIIVKRTDTSTNWYVYHRSNGAGSSMYLDTTDTVLNTPTFWNETTPSSTTFTLGTGSTNTNGGSYVAYLFAHEAGGFGLTGTDNIITCGTYTGNSGENAINLGYEPQWVMIKQVGTASGGTGWIIFDNNRGVAENTIDRYIFANANSAEATAVNFIKFTSTGFTLRDAGAGSVDNTNAGPEKYIYVAIRRGPMEIPTSSESVFNIQTWTGSNAARTLTGIGFPLDMCITHIRNLSGTSAQSLIFDRLRGAGTTSAKRLAATGSDGESDYTSVGNFDLMDGFRILDGDSLINDAGIPSTYVGYFYRRAPSFFDMLCYTGSGSAGKVITHNLGKAPELIITRVRNFSGEDWIAHYNDGTSVIGGYLNSTTGFANSATAPSTDISTVTSTTYTLNTTNRRVNGAYDYVAYLFATCPGVSKVGTYTGTGTTKQIDCGFSGSARFVLIKRTDSTGDWYTYDSARGIVAGDDPYLFLNSTTAEVTNTDYIDTYTGGFELSSTAPAALNANGGTFIFLAIA